MLHRHVTDEHTCLRHVQIMNKKISLEELIKGKKFTGYPEEAEYIFGLIRNGNISPVKASGTNGKSPALYNRYWLHEEEEDDTQILNEINFKLDPGIQTDYYKNHTDVYRRERELVLSLSRWLCDREKYAVTISVNERSFEIWGREKFLSGQRIEGVSAADILRHCGVSADKLNIYQTAEPFAYYTHSAEVPQNILILENLDPYFGLRKYLLETGGEIFGVRISSLVYGGGKRIVRSFGDFELSAEPYLLDKGNIFYYAGDLDYEGIGIYESLAEKVGESLKIQPFTAYYEKMLEKAEKRTSLAKMKEGQNPVKGERFFGCFPATESVKIRNLLSDGYYIPQEILNICDYSGSERS